MYIYIYIHTHIYVYVCTSIYVVYIYINGFFFLYENLIFEFFWNFTFFPLHTQIPNGARPIARTTHVVLVFA